MNETDFRALLSGDDTEARRAAIIALAKAPEAIVADLVMQGLADTDWRVRKEAVRVCGELAATEVLMPRLIDAVLQGDNVGLRNAALSTLGAFGPASGPPLLEALERPGVPATALKFLAEGLGGSGYEDAVGALAELLERFSAEEGVGAQIDTNTAASVLDALARLGGAAAQEALAGQLHADDAYLQMAALDGLSRTGARVPFEQLDPLLGRPMLRRVALELLGRTRHPDALPPLFDALSDPSRHVVGLAACSAVQLVDENPKLGPTLAELSGGLSSAARRSLRQILLEDGFAERQAAAHVLLLARDVDALEGTLALMSEGGLPSEALAAMRRWGTDAVEPLLEIFGAAQGLVSALALELASELLAAERHREDTDREAFATLAEQVRSAIDHAVASREEDVRRAGIRSLGTWVKPSDAVRLVRIASDGTAETATACCATLRRLSEEHPDAVRAALGEATFERPGSAAFCELLASLAPSDAIDRLRAAQSSVSAEVRRAAALALGHLGGPAAAEHVGYALTDDDLNVRAAAASALGQLRRDEGEIVEIEPLLGTLYGESPAVRAAAARALGVAGAPAAIPALRELVADDEAAVASAAINALRLLGDDGAADALGLATMHGDGEVARAALTALAAAPVADTAERVARGLSHPEWHVRAHAAHTLGMLGDDAIPFLEAHLADEKDALAKTAIERALGLEETDAS